MKPHLRSPPPNHPGPPPLLHRPPPQLRSSDACHRRPPLSPQSKGGWGNPICDLRRQTTPKYSCFVLLQLCAPEELHEQLYVISTHRPNKQQRTTLRFISTHYASLHPYPKMSNERGGGVEKRRYRKPSHLYHRLH